MLSEEEILLRLLEISALLLPVVAILLQVALRLYESEDESISDEQKRYSVLIGTGAIGVLLFAALNTVLALMVPVRLFDVSGTLLLILFALVLISLSVMAVGMDAAEAYGGLPKIETSSPDLPNSHINALRSKLANIIAPPSSLEEPEETEEPDNE